MHPDSTRTIPCSQITALGRGVAPRRQAKGRAGRNATVLAALLLMLGSGVEAKVTRCAGSVQEILDAITTINATPTQSFDLRIKSGYYTLPLASTNVHAIFKIDRAFNVTGVAEGTLSRISGAWNSNCSSQAAVGAIDASTVLDGQSVGDESVGGGVPILTVVARPTTPAVEHTIKIDRINFYRGGPNWPNKHLLEYTNALTILDYTTPRSLHVELDRIRVDSTRGGPAVRIGEARSAIVRNSLFLRNVPKKWVATPNQHSTGAALSLESVGMGEVRNNTFRYNTPGRRPSDNYAHPVLDFRGTSHAHAQPSAIYRNIFADNSLSEQLTLRAIGPSGGIIADNRIDILAHGVSAPAEFDVSGTTAVDPGFQSAFYSALSATSALCDYGNLPAWTLPNEVDHLGNPRLAGARPEPGAYEQPACSTSTEIMSNGFE